MEDEMSNINEQMTKYAEKYKYTVKVYDKDNIGGWEHLVCVIFCEDEDIAGKIAKRVQHHWSPRLSPETLGIRVSKVDIDGINREIMDSVEFFAKFGIRHSPKYVKIMTSTSSEFGGD